MNDHEETVSEIARLSLPEGPTGLEPEEVAASQRRRLQLALALVSHRRGYEMASVDAISQAALLSKATLYALFGGKEGVLISAVAEFAAGARAAVASAVEPESSPERRAIAAVEALVAHVAGEPQLARLAFVEAPRMLKPGAGGSVADELLSDIVDLGGDSEPLGAETGGDGLGHESFVRTAAVGGLREPIFRRLLEGRYGEIAGLSPALAHFAIALRAGPERAAEIVA